MAETLVSPVILDNKAVERLGDYRFGALRRPYAFAREAWLVTGEESDAVIGRMNWLAACVAGIRDQLGWRDLRDIHGVLIGNLMLVGRPRDLQAAPEEDANGELAAIARQASAHVALRAGYDTNGPLYIGAEELQAFKDAGTAITNACPLASV